MHPLEFGERTFIGLVEARSGLRQTSHNIRQCLTPLP